MCESIGSEMPPKHMRCHHQRVPRHLLSHALPCTIALCRILKTCPYAKRATVLSCQLPKDPPHTSCIHCITTLTVGRSRCEHLLSYTCLADQDDLMATVPFVCDELMSTVPFVCDQRLALDGVSKLMSCLNGIKSVHAVFCGRGPVDASCQIC